MNRNLSVKQICAAGIGNENSESTNVESAQKNIEFISVFEDLDIKMTLFLPKTM